MERLQDNFSSARNKAIARAIKRGEDNLGVLLALGDQAVHKEQYKVGLESERNFRKFAKKHKFIKNFRASSPYEDMDGIDFICIFSEYLHLPALPVQVKSSSYGINFFFGGKNFEKKHGRIIVLNCGEETDKDSFDDQLRSEIKRVRKLLKKRKRKSY